MSFARNLQANCTSFGYLHIGMTKNLLRCKFYQARGKKHFAPPPRGLQTEFKLSLPAPFRARQDGAHGVLVAPPYLGPIDDVPKII